jgi:uncharacterized protein (TIGR02217 family)
MQYHDILLPDFLSVHLKGGPVFSTVTASTISGREIRSYERQNALQKYSLEGCRLSHDEFQKFNSFFRARMGCAYAFRIRDHADFKIENQVIAITDGVSKEFEIYKSYEDEACSYRRKISAIRADMIEANFDIKNIDREHGVIHTRELLVLGRELLITAEFDVWVRFTSDEFRYSSSMDGSVLIEDLGLVEVI